MQRVTLVPAALAALALLVGATSVTGTASAGTGGHSESGERVVTFSLARPVVEPKIRERAIVAGRVEVAEARQRERALSRARARLLGRARVAPLLSDRLRLQKRAAQLSVRLDVSRARTEMRRAALRAQRDAAAAREAATAWPPLDSSVLTAGAAGDAGGAPPLATPPPWIPDAPGAPAAIDPRLGPALALAREMGLPLTSGHRPGAIVAGTTSPSDHSHFPSKAIDIGGSPTAMYRYAVAVARLPGVDTVIYSPVGLWKASTGWTSIRSAVTRRDHFDHVHVDTF